MPRTCIVRWEWEVLRLAHARSGRQDELTLAQDDKTQLTLAQDDKTQRTLAQDDKMNSHSLRTTRRNSRVLKTTTQPTPAQNEDKANTRSGRQQSQHPFKTTRHNSHSPTPTQDDNARAKITRGSHAPAPSIIRWKPHPTI